MKQQRVDEIPFLIRAVWFLLLGWHLSAYWIAIAWLLNVSIIGLPVGVWMLNRVPQILTLKADSGSYVLDKTGGVGRYMAGRQHPLLLRAAYFVIFGWWISLVWASIGYLLSLTIIFLPVGVLMLNRLPFVTTLRR